MSIKAIELFGDSLFQNMSYTLAGESVIDHMHRLSPVPVSQLAVDGDITTDTLLILEDRGDDFNPETGAVLSVGGNDSLRSASILECPVSSVFESFTKMIPILDAFRSRYIAVLERLLKMYEVELIRVLTIHNRVPISPTIPREALAALALFNEIILEECSRRKLQIIDLRVICESPDSYSEISPIEPSGIGGLRISEAILNSYKKEV
jgi:hypothetical protein